MTIGERIYTEYDGGRGGTIAEVAARLGVNPNTARRAKRDYEKALDDRGGTGLADRLALDEPGFEFVENHQSARANGVAEHRLTLEEFIALCGVDLSVWRVAHWEAKHYSAPRKQVFKDLQFDEGRISGVIQDTGHMAVQPMWSYHARFVLRETVAWEGAIERAIERLQDEAPDYPRQPPAAPGADYLLVPNLYDAHFNKLSANGGYTIERAATDFKAVADALVERVCALGMPVERVLLPTGHDALHADNLAGTTTDGTPLELAADQRDAVDALIDAFSHLIERCAELAPVDVVVVESNHDRFASYMLGKVLEARFSRHPSVTVDASRAPRKYYRYGATLIGMEHGDKVKPRDLGLLMADEARAYWADTSYREWLRGHVHYAAGMYHPVTSDGGVTVRVIPALCPPDQYHVLHGFVGSQRAAEALYYSREHGPAGGFPVFVDEVAH